MQTLVEKIYTQREGRDGLYKMLSHDEIRIPASFPGAGIEIPMNFPGPEMPTEFPLEVRLGYQGPQGLYAMYSFGVNPSFDPRPMSSGPTTFQPMGDFGLPTGGYGPGPADPDLAYDRIMRKKNHFYDGKADYSLRENVCGLEFQYRAGEHEDYGKNHINFETLNPVGRGPEFGGRLDNDHWY